VERALLPAAFDFDLDFGRESETNPKSNAKFRQRAGAPAPHEQTSQSKASETFSNHFTLFRVALQQRVYNLFRFPQSFRNSG
jgi:hypothetical protein